MTINVTVRVPDGIVIASDSLASQQNPLQLPPVNVAGRHKCSSCGNEDDFGLAVQTTAIGVPANSSPLATKLFYVGQFGVAFHGMSAVGGRTLCNHVLNYVHTDFASANSAKTVREVADDLSTILHEALKRQLGDLNKIPQDATALGFQIAGYNPSDLDSGSAYMVAIGRDKKIEETKSGVEFGGVGDVVTRMYPNLPTDNASLDLMTLSDAVDYARFLIRTTSDYQRFAKMVPVVGGPIDIAVITKWAGFRWVQRKTLLGPDEVRLNVGKVAEEMRTLSRKQDDLTRVVEELLATDEAGDTGDANGTPQLKATA